MKSAPPGIAARAVLALLLACAASALPARAQEEPAAPPRVRLVAALESYEGPSRLNGRPALAAFSPDGRRLVTGGTDKTAYLYELNR